LSNPEKAAQSEKAWFFEYYQNFSLKIRADFALAK